MTRGSQLSLAADMDLGGFVLGLLLEYKRFIGPIKVGVSTQIKSRGCVFGASAGDALSQF